MKPNQPIPGHALELMWTKNAGPVGGSPRPFASVGPAPEGRPSHAKGREWHRQHKDEIRNGPKTGHRILWNRRGEDIDEVVFTRPEAVHIEQMHGRCWWIAVTFADGTYWAGNFTSTSRRMKFNEHDNNGVRWDRDDTHEAKR